MESTDSFTCIEEEYRSFSLKNTCLRQYIEQEIEMLEHSHHRLLHRKKELEEIKGVSVDQKVAILKALKAIEEDQQRELVMLAYE